jgi:hypothetical protein
MLFHHWNLAQVTVLRSAFGVRGSPFAVRRSPFGVRGSPFAVRGLPFAVCGLQSTPLASTKRSHP